jgi:hypothetical protein
MQLQPAIIFARHFYISNAIKASHRYMTPIALSILILCFPKDFVQISRFLYSAEFTLDSEWNIGMVE